MIYKFPRMNSLVNLEQRVFLSAILLGGSLTDYYNVCLLYTSRVYTMEQSFIAFLEDSIKKNWDLDALTDYKGATLQYKDCLLYTSRCV